MITPAIKKYMFIMYELARSGNSIRSIDISKALGINKASVSTMLPRLIEQNFIKRNKDNVLEFTSGGAKYASEIYLKYLTIYRFFERLGSSDDNARKDAINCICSLSDENTENITNYILNDTADNAL